MTVEKLIEELKKCDQEKEVMISSDAEGNSINLINNVDHVASEPTVIIWPV